MDCFPNFLLLIAGEIFKGFTLQKTTQSNGKPAGRFVIDHAELRLIAQVHQKITEINYKNAIQLCR
jgi:hypothetical protein